MVNIGKLHHFGAHHRWPRRCAAPRLADFGGRQGPVAEAFEAAPQLAQGLGIALADQGLVGGFNHNGWYMANNWLINGWNMVII